jgi:hypothetical protein
VVGDTVGCGYDRKAKIIFFTRNGVHLGKAFEVSLGTFFAVVGLRVGGTAATVNFGQRPFLFPVHTYTEKVLAGASSEGPDDLVMGPPGPAVVVVAPGEKKAPKKRPGHLSSESSEDEDEDEDNEEGSEDNDETKEEIMAAADRIAEVLTKMDTDDAENNEDEEPPEEEDKTSSDAEADEENLKPDDEEEKPDDEEKEEDEKEEDEEEEAEKKDKGKEKEDDEDEETPVKKPKPSKKARKNKKKNDETDTCFRQFINYVTQHPARELFDPQEGLEGELNHDEENDHLYEEEMGEGTPSSDLVPIAPATIVAVPDSRNPSSRRIVRHGTVVAVSYITQRVQLQVYYPETGTSTTKWYPISEVLQKASSNSSKQKKPSAPPTSFGKIDPFFTSKPETLAVIVNDAEQSLAVLYSRMAVSSILNSVIKDLEKGGKSEDVSISEFLVSMFGNIHSVINFLKTAAEQHVKISLSSFFSRNVYSYASESHIGFRAVISPAMNLYRDLISKLLQDNPTPKFFESSSPSFSSSSSSSSSSPSSSSSSSRSTLPGILVEEVKDTLQRFAMDSVATRLFGPFILKSENPCYEPPSAELLQSQAPFITTRVDMDSTGKRVVTIYHKVTLPCDQVLVQFDSKSLIGTSPSFPIQVYSDEKFTSPLAIYKRRVYQPDLLPAGTFFIRIPIPQNITTGSYRIIFFPGGDFKVRSFLLSLLSVISTHLPSYFKTD